MTEWHCQAYGPQGTEVGALCFFSPELGERDCASEEQCHTRLAAERVRVVDRIAELGATGDPGWRELAEEITDPEQILGGERNRREPESPV